jgi:putative ABC transport system permease protein
MASPRINKVIRDLTANKARSILVVLSIAVGIFAFSGVFTANTLFIQEMDKQSAQSNPSTITISINQFDQDLVDWVKLQQGVKDAEGRLSRVVKLKQDGKTSIMTILAIPDYQNIRVNKLIFLGNTQPPAINEALVERTTLVPAHLAIGSTLTFETTSGEDRQLVVSGTVHDINAIPANLFPQFTAYVNMQTARKIGFPIGFNQLLIATDNSIKTLDDATLLSESLKKDIENRGYSVQNTQVRAPNQHWAKDVSQAFLMILNVVGSFSLALSAFLVINTVTSLITREKKQIGIMKAVGAVRRQIIIIYLESVLLFGILAFLVALPIGLLLAYVNLKFVAGFLNIDITHFYLPLNILILEITISILVPLIASFIPIVRGTRVSVAESLSSRSPKKKKSKIERLLFLFKSFPRPALLAIRNTFNNIGRLILTLGTLVTAGVLFISVLSVRSSLLADFNSSLKVQNYDVVIYLSDWYGVDELKHLLNSSSDVKNSEVQVSTSAKDINSPEVRSNFAIIGVNPSSNFILPQITQGRWLTDSDKKSIVLSSAAAKAHPEYRLGDTLTLEINEHDYDFTILGVMVLTSGQGEDPTIYTDYHTLATILGKNGRANSVLIQQADNSTLTQQQLVEQVEDLLKSRGFNSAASITTDTIRQSSSGQFNFLIVFLLSLAVMVALVGGLGLTGTMSLNVLERTREIGILRGIGADDNIIRQMVVVEGFTIGLLSFLIAVPLSLPASYAFGAVIGLAFIQKPLVFSYSVVGVLIWFIIVTTISILASLVPARRASRMSVRDALSYE